MPYEPIIPEGAHLGISHGPDGGQSGLLFDDVTGKLIGQASWHDTGESSSGSSGGYQGPSYKEPQSLTPEEQEALANLAALIVLAVIAAAPVVKRWWENAVLPAAQVAWRQVVRKIRARRKHHVDDAGGNRAELAASAVEARDVVADSKITMSRAEWATRYQAMLAASAFSEEQRRLLSMARVLDGGPAGQQLTAQQVADRLQLKLQANPVVLEEANSAAVLAAITVSPSDSKGVLQLEP